MWETIPVSSACDAPSYLDGPAISGLSQSGYSPSSVLCPAGRIRKETQT
jgi:hypothetical protein